MSKHFNQMHLSSYSLKLNANMCQTNQPSWYHVSCRAELRWVDSVQLSSVCTIGHSRVVTPLTLCEIEIVNLSPTFPWNQWYYCSLQEAKARQQYEACDIYCWSEEETLSKRRQLISTLWVILLVVPLTWSTLTWSKKNRQWLHWLFQYWWCSSQAAQARQ